MRLFLSSYRAGRHADKLVELFGQGTKVAVITNAKDYKTVEERKVKVSELLEFFTNLGLKPDEVDLRQYFGDSEGLEEKICAHPSVWLAGGNTFLLRRALRQSGLEELLSDMVRGNEIVLGGDSAGAIVVGPTLKGSENESDPEDNPYFKAEGYDDEIIWEGLDYINYVPVPHYQSADYGPVIDKYIKDLERQKIAYKTMTDDQAIMINGDKEEFLE